MISAFQSNAFQNNAFQIQVGGIVEVEIGAGTQITRAGLAVARSDTITNVGDVLTTQEIVTRTGLQFSRTTQVS